MRSLPASERKLLESADWKESDFPVSSEINIDAVPPEELLYEKLKQKSHSLSLLDQLKVKVSPALREQCESYISQQAATVGYKSLVSSNLQQASDLAVVNLYWYFKVRDQSQQETYA